MASVLEVPRSSKAQVMRSAKAWAAAAALA
jgi:hypothetical protein